MVDPGATVGQLPAGDDGGESARDAVHRLSTGAHKLPVSPLDPLVHQYRCGGSSYRTTPLRRRSFIW
jgi:hypothetical protein